MTVTLQPRVFDLLRMAEAASNGSPTTATAWRHRDPGALVSPTSDAHDPVLFLGVVSFQSEPFQPGAYFWGPVDPATGAVGLHVDVVDHPLDRVASYQAAVGMCRAINEHMTVPHLARRNHDGQPVEAIDDHVRASELPRILVANTGMARALGYLGRRFTYLRVPEDADAATRADLEVVRAAGRWLREVDELSKYSGQNQVVDLLEQVCELYVVPLPTEERGHLGAVCGAVTSGPIGGWAAEGDFVGPVPDPETQDELWALHNHLRGRLRGSIKDGRTATATRQRLQRRYEALAAETLVTCRLALDLLAAVPFEPTQATVRRAEDLTRYAIAGSRAVGWNRPGRSVRPLLENALTVERRERAHTVHELRRLMLEPRLRSPLWGTGGAFDGTRCSVTSRRVPAGGVTPTGRPKTSTEWEVAVEVYDPIGLPKVGDVVLWCGHLGMQVQGIVSTTAGRIVTVKVPPGTTNASSLKEPQPGGHDAWIVEKRPYLGDSPRMPRADLPALFRTPFLASTDETVPDGGDPVVDAVIVSAVDAQRDYQ